MYLHDALPFVEVVRIAPIPATHRAVGQRQFGMADHARGVEYLGHAEAVAGRAGAHRRIERERSEEHTSELQSLMRISDAVFGLTKKHTNGCTGVHTCIKPTLHDNAYKI